MGTSYRFLFDLFYSWIFDLQLYLCCNWCSCGQRNRYPTIYISDYLASNAGDLCWFFLRIQQPSWTHCRRVFFVSLNFTYSHAYATSRGSRRRRCALMAIVALYSTIDWSLFDHRLVGFKNLSRRYIDVWQAPYLQRTI